LQREQRRVPRLVGATIGALGVLLPNLSMAETQDGVYALCVERETPETCRCASERLKPAITPDEYGIYHDIGIVFAQMRSDGKGYVPAWDEASERVATQTGTSVGELRTRTNRIGRAHRDAIKACGG